MAAIAMQPWFQNVLTGSGFENRQNIVMLEWQYQPWALHETPGVRIRKMVEADLPEVERTDAASFPPLWQNPIETLRRGFGQALFATVATKDCANPRRRVSKGFCHNTGNAAASVRSTLGRSASSILRMRIPSASRDAQG